MTTRRRPPDRTPDRRRSAAVAAACSTCAATVSRCPTAAPRRANTSCTPARSLVVPLLDDGRVVLVRQYRYPVGRRDARVARRQARRRRADAGLRDARTGRGDRLPRDANGPVAASMHNADRLFDRKHRDLVRARADCRRARSTAANSSSRATHRRTELDAAALARRADRRQDADRRCTGCSSGAAGRWPLAWHRRRNRRRADDVRHESARPALRATATASKAGSRPKTTFSTRTAAAARVPAVRRHGRHAPAERAAAEPVGRTRCATRSPRTPAPRRRRSPQPAADLQAAWLQRGPPPDGQHRGRRRPLRRRGAPHPLRRGRASAASAARRRAEDARRCATKASRRLQPPVPAALKGPMQ